MSSIMTVCVSSIGTDLIYVCSVWLSDPSCSHPPPRVVGLGTISRVVAGVPGIGPAPLLSDAPKKGAPRKAWACIIGRTSEIWEI